MILKPSTRERMIETASRLFRRDGYAAVGVARILEESGAPRGSLYHHFPGGKAQIAEEVASYACDAVSALIDRAYDGATSPEAGDAVFVEKIARLFENSGAREGCPVSVFLHGGDDRSDEWARRVSTIYDEWTARLAAQHERLGQDAEQARATAREMLIRLQGAWVVAIAEREPTAIRDLTEV